MVFERRHFQAVAEILGKHCANDEMVESFMTYFEEDNPRFDRARFTKAVIKVKEANKCRV